MRRFLALALLCASLPSCLGECQAVGGGALGGGAIGTGQVGAGAVGGSAGASGAQAQISASYIYAARLETGFSDTDPVGTMTNFGSAGGSATQTAGNRPTYQTAEIDSQAVFRFDGTDDYLEHGSLTLTFPITVCWVAESDAPANVDAILLVDDTNAVDSDTPGVFLAGNPPETSWEARTYSQQQNGIAHQDELVPFLSANRWTQGCARIADRHDVDPQMTKWIDGVLMQRTVTSTQNSWTPTTFMIGGWSGGSFWDGDVAEIRVYENTTLANPDPASVRTELLTLYPSLPQAASMNANHRWRPTDETGYADGANVTALADSGTDSDWDLVSDGAPPNYVDIGYQGYEAIHFTDASNEFLEVITGVTYPITVCAILRHDQDQTEVITSATAGAFGSTQNYLFHWTGSTGWTANSLTSSGRPSVNHTPGVGVWSTVCAYMPSSASADTTSRIIANGAYKEGTSGSDNTATEFTVGAGGPNVSSSPFDGDLVDLMVWEASTPTAPDIHDAALGMVASHARSADTCDLSAVTGCPDSGRCRMVILGDSLNSHVYNTYDVWAEEIRRRMEARYGRECFSMSNLGISGTESSNMLTSWNDEVSGNGYHVLFTWGGNNDMRNGTGVGSEDTDAIANLDAIHAGANAEGLLVVNLGMFPYKNDSFATWSADKQTQTDAVMAEMSSDGTITYLDAYSTIEDGTTPDQVNDSWDVGDLVHLNDTGHEAIADLVMGLLLP